MENIENNENLVVDQTTENVENTTEQTPKTFTQEDVDRMVKEKLDEVLPGKIARKEAKIRKEYDRKYGGLTEVLKAGTGKEDVDEMTDTFKKFYKSKGINIPEKQNYSDRDIEILARAEADDIIQSGYDDVVEEVDRLTEIGAANMTAREKAVFKSLAEYRQTAERGKELSKLGVTEDVYNSKEFKEFASKFNSTTPITDIYDIYSKTQNKKEIRTMGSMKNNTTDEGTVKDFYTRDEALQFTKKDLDKNPALYKAIEQSMLKW